LGIARKRDRNLDIAGSKTEFVPALYHAGPPVQVVITDLIYSDYEGAILGSQLGWIIPLQVPSRPIMVVHGLPEWVIAWIKCSALGLKFVTEDQIVLLAVKPGASLGVLGRVLVDQARQIRQVGNLAGSIDPTQIVASPVNWPFVELDDDRVPSEKHNEAEAKENDHSEIHPASGTEKIALAIKPAQSGGRWVVELVI
jgi:hypothetical protein